MRGHRKSVYLLNLSHLERNLKKVFSEEDIEVSMKRAVNGDSTRVLRELGKDACAMFLAA